MACATGPGAARRIGRTWVTSLYVLHRS